jgi:2-C-methyl-D-erythritol 4-phosphate cytidylyltransferase
VTVGVVLVAAGRGERLGAGGPKALVRLGERTLVEHAVARLVDAGLPPPVVVRPPDDDGEVARCLAGQPVAACVPGGATRTDSVRAGVAALPDEVDVVAVHDAARALLPPAVARRAVDAVAGDVVAAAPALPVSDTLKRVVAPLADAPVTVHGTVDRATLVAVQTPQVFRREVLETALASGRTATDELTLVEELIAAGEVSGRVVVVPGAAAGLKVTYPDDLRVAATFLRDAGEREVAR